MLRPPWVAQPVSGKPVLELGSVFPHAGAAGTGPHNYLSEVLAHCTQRAAPQSGDDRTTVSLPGASSASGGTVQVGFPSARPTPHRGVSGQRHEESARCFRNPLPRRPASSALSHPTRRWDCPFTQSQAGNRSRLRCLPSKAKVHARNSVFHGMLESFRNQMFTWPKGCSEMEMRGLEQPLRALKAERRLSHQLQNE